MRRLKRHVQRRLHRKLFFWFGATIVLTALMVSLVQFVLAGFGRPPWRQDAERFSQFVGKQFEAVWRAPEARSAFARSIADDLDVRVILKDPQDKEIAVYGPECRRWTWDVPVRSKEATLGAVGFCVPHRGSDRSVKFILTLIVILGVLWAMSGKIARHIARPLGRLTQVAQRLGEGDLSARARFRTRDEVGVLAQAIDDMADRIERQIQEQKTLLAAVSHELRTPLGHLRLLVEIAQQDPEEAKATLLDIDKEVQEIDALVGELLASSRLDFTHLDSTGLDVRTVAEHAARRAGLDPDDVVEVEANLTSVTADATLLARALANLLANADKHGGGVDRLRVRTQEGAVAFEVLDGGPGIPESEHHRVFEPFYRGDGGGRGTLGLGLALVGRIAKAHGGRAYVHNREEGGAIVGFTCGHDGARRSEASAV